MKLLKFCIFVGLCFCSTSAFAWESIQRLEGAVNADVILTSDITRFKHTTTLRSQIDPLFANTSFASRVSAASNAEIRDFLIEELLILQQFPVSDSEVEQEIASIQSNNNLSKEDLKSALAAQGFRFEDYFELIRVGTSKRNLIDREIRSRSIISDDDLRNHYYNYYSKSSLTPFEYKIKIISFAKKEDAEKALAKIKSGGSLDSLSPDDSTETGFVHENEIQPLFRSSLSKLSPGEVSGVLSGSPTAFFIVRLIDKKTGVDSQFEKVKEEIKAKMSALEYQRQIQLWVDKQRGSSFIYRAAS